MSLRKLLPPVAASLPLIAAGLAAIAIACTVQPVGGPGAGGGRIGEGAERDPASADIPPLAGVPTEGRRRIRRALPTGDIRTSAILLEKDVPDEVVLGIPFEYRIVVENLTDLDLKEVRVQDVIPEGLSIEDIEPIGSIDDGVAQWNLGTLAPGSAKTLVVRGTADSIGTITTSATVDYVSALSASSRVVAPRLEVAVEAPPRALVDDPFEVSVRVSNVGTGTARDVQLTKVLPEGYAGRDGQQRLVVEFGDIAAGQVKEETFSVTADVGERFEQSLAVQAAGGLTASSETFTVVVEEPRLTLSVNAPETALAANPIRIEFTVGNTGNGISRDTILECPLPVGVQIVSTSAEGNVAGGIVTWRIGELEPGGTAQVAFTVWREEPGAFVTSATVRAPSAGEDSQMARTSVE